MRHCLYLKIILLQYFQQLTVSKQIRCGETQHFLTGFQHFNNSENELNVFGEKQTKWNLKFLINYVKWIRKIIKSIKYEFHSGNCVT